MLKIRAQEPFGEQATIPGVPKAAHGRFSNRWRHSLPTLHGSSVVLREVRHSDAVPLLSSMSTEEVSRFISPPPTTVAGFESFIACAKSQRAAGRSLCFTVVPRGSEVPVGLYQLRSLDHGFRTAEWGFAIDAEFWGSGMFADAAHLIVDFAITAVGVRRLEARAVVNNGRGNGALRKIGAVQEGLLRRSFLRRGEYLDQALWAILADEWLQAKATWGSHVVH